VQHKNYTLHVNMHIAYCHKLGEYTRMSEQAEFNIPFNKQ